MSLRVVNSLALIVSMLLVISCAASKASKKEMSRAHFELGRSLILDGKPREGLEYLMKAAKNEPSNPEIQNQLAVAYQKIGEYDRSIDHFQRAVRLNPGYSEAINNMGIVYTQLGKWDKALECFEKAADDHLYKTPHFAYHNIGSVYFHKKEFPKAIENYQKALKLEPAYESVYYDLASAYIALNQYDDAIEIYRKAGVIDQQSRKADLNLAKLYIKLARTQDAKKLLKLIIESDPRSQAAKEANQLLQNLELSQPGKNVGQ